ERGPVRQGRVPRLRRSRAGRGREPRGRGHEGRLPLPARDPGGPRGDPPATPHRRRGGRRRRPEPRLRGPHPRGGRVLRAPHSRTLGEGEQAVVRQAYASLLWSKKFYHYVVKDWLEGDPAQPPPPASRLSGRNHDWPHLHNRDVISMPEGWEYPWYAAWDLAFHMIPFARIDPSFAKEQLVLFTREWYMNPS